MIINKKDFFKFFGVSIIIGCAVLVSTLFINFNFDLTKIKPQLVDEFSLQLYDAQIILGQMIATISGIFLLLTASVVLAFYIKNYIVEHEKELGILKALGYSSGSIAKQFAIFGVSIFIGAVIGYGVAHLIMPAFYQYRLEAGILPEFQAQFNIELFALMVIVPTIIYSLGAVVYSAFKLRISALSLLRGSTETKTKNKKIKYRQNDSFLADLKKTIVRNSYAIAFFVLIASLSYSAMMQMSIAMYEGELLSETFAAVMMVIGIVLASTILIISITSIINKNAKYFSLMKVFGYTSSKCSQAVLSGYRGIAYIGFLVGTAYQYFLTKMIIFLFTKDTDFGVSEIEFNVKIFLLTLVSFIVIYEVTMQLYKKRIEHISVKKVMMD